MDNGGSPEDKDQNLKCLEKHDLCTEQYSVALNSRKESLAEWNQNILE